MKKKIFFFNLYFRLQRNKDSTWPFGSYRMGKINAKFQLLKNIQNISKSI